jgi:hypothetical protein
MEKQMRAERDKRAAILHAEGDRQSKILTAEGTRQQQILEAQGAREASILRADGEAKAVDLVFKSVHRNDADPKVLAYKYLETLPELAQSGNTFWVIPGELTQAVRTITEAFSRDTGPGAPVAEAGAEEVAQSLEGEKSTRELTSGDQLAMDAESAADQAVKDARAAVSSAKAEAEAAEAGKR